MLDSMYAAHFGLQHEPFSIAPDPRYLFMSERHREALAHLLYGVQGGGGFVLLTGEIGAGKTTVCRAFLEQAPRRCNVAYIFNPKLSVVELLRTVCDEFHVPWQARTGGEPSVKDLIDPLNEYLLRTHAVGQNNLLIIDEAQNLAPEVLEQLRLLTNLETHERKLLQIILIGQPELRDMVASPALEQLAQRVIARYHLDALSEAETAHYVQHRLTVAGHPHGAVFEPAALRRVHALSRGVPRRINLLCDRALLGAYAQGHTQVTAAVVSQAATEVFGRDGVGSKVRRQAWAAGLVLVAAGMGWLAWSLHTPGAWHRLSTAVSASSPVVGASTAAAASVAQQAAVAPLPVLNDAEALVEAGWRVEHDAWRMLAKRWGVDATAWARPCGNEADKAALQCFRGNGGLAWLAQLDRPGWLRLHGPKGDTSYVLVRGLDQTGRRVHVEAVHGLFTVDVALLSGVWRGEAGTFWRTPPGYSGMLPAGAAGPSVTWLAERLNQVDGGRVTESHPPQLDAALINRVRAFQVRQGLTPDGLVGPTTWMALNRVAGVNEPRLDTERK